MNHEGNTGEPGPALGPMAGVDAKGLMEEAMELRAYLKAVARKMLGWPLRGKVDESDIVQEVELNVLRWLEKNPGVRVADRKAWLAKAVVNQVHKLRARFATDKRDAGRDWALADGSGSGQQPVDRCQTPFSAAAGREKAARHLEALERLPQPFRQIIELKILEGLSYDLVAEQVGLTKDQVRSRLAQGLNKLRTMLEKNP